MSDDQPPRPIGKNNDEPHPRFSLVLQDEIVLALHECTASLGTMGEARLTRAADRVGVEARARQLPPEQMLLALKRLYTERAKASVSDELWRRGAYDRFISACIDAYFTAGEND